MRTFSMGGASALGAFACGFAAACAGAEPPGPRLKPSTTFDTGIGAAPGWAATPQLRQAVGGFSWNTTLPSRSRTVSMNHGVTRKPPLANTA